MNVNPAAAASVAGTSRAAAKGGDSDNQATQASARQAAAQSPNGKAEGDNSLDAGEQTSDRDANGRQVFDIFERSDEQKAKDENEKCRSAPFDSRWAFGLGSLVVFTSGEPTALAAGFGG